MCRYFTFLAGNRWISSYSRRFLYVVDRQIVPDTNSRGNVRILDVRCNGDHCKGLHQQDLLLHVKMLRIRQDFRAHEQGHHDERDGISHHRPGRYHVEFGGHLRGDRQGGQPRSAAIVILFNGKNTNTIQEYTLTLPHVRDSHPPS